MFASCPGFPLLLAASIRSACRDPAHACDLAIGANWNADGKIVDFKVMVRPLKAVNAIHAAMGRMLEALKPAKA